MRPILTPAESAALDAESARRGVRVLDLMERAGWATAVAARTLAGGGYGRRAVVVCGKGNNAGDGLVAARVLERWGMGVTAVLLADPSAFRGPALANLRRYRDGGGRLLRFSPGRLARELRRADVAVDAIFGTGFHGPPEGPAGEAIRALNDAGVATVAVDVPSGVDGETGAVAGAAVRADLTVTLGALKPGVVLYPGAGLAGVVEVADIGFPPDLVRSDLWLVEASDVAGWLRPREAESHKRASGVVLVVAGSRAMTGAAVLTASAASRAGAGLVNVAVPESALPVVEAGVTEATFLPLPETADGAVAAGAWEALRERLGAVQAVAVGPGLGTAPETVEVVRRLVAESPVALVVDADGLNAFAGQGSLLAERRADAVLTPHPGEFGRLTGLSSKDALEDRVGHARKAAADLRCTVLLKGSRTVIAEPGGRAVVNPTGGPFLATGGTGDVLTGAVAALLARGLPPEEAAAAAAYVHGVAGRLAAAERGEGTVASDVLDRLPGAIQAVRRAGAEGEPS